MSFLHDTAENYLPNYAIGTIILNEYLFKIRLETKECVKWQK